MMGIEPIERVCHCPIDITFKYKHLQPPAESSFFYMPKLVRIPTFCSQTQRYYPQSCLPKLCWEDKAIASERNEALPGSEMMQKADTQTYLIPSGHWESEATCNDHSLFLICNRKQQASIISDKKNQKSV